MNNDFLGIRAFRHWLFNVYQVGLPFISVPLRFIVDFPWPGQDGASCFDTVRLHLWCKHRRAVSTPVRNGKLSTTHQHNVFGTVR
jgi:hypothetical protein